MPWSSIILSCHFEEFNYCQNVLLVLSLRLIQFIGTFSFMVRGATLLVLATRQTDVSTSAIQIPTTPPPPPIIPNRREIRDWLIVDRQIGSFYEVRVNSRERKLTGNCFICVSQHNIFAIYLFSH